MKPSVLVGGFYFNYYLKSLPNTFNQIFVLILAPLELKFTLAPRLPIVVFTPFWLMFR